MNNLRGEVARNPDWERSERYSFWIALAIALAPIPIAFLVSWVVGSNLGGDLSELDHERPATAPADPDGSRPR